MVEVELLLVVIDDAHFLGAGEQPRIRGGAGARRDGAPVEQVVGLIGLQRAELVGAEIRHHMRVGLGQQHGGPVFVGDAQPRIGGVEGEDLLFLDLLVGDFLTAFVAEFSDQAFVQNVVAERLRRAVARDQRERKQRHRFVGLVRHLVLDGEQIFVVDRDAAAEHEALAVVIGERHRMADGERAGTALRPQRVGRWHLQAGAGGIGPAEFGVERIRAAGRRQQHDRRRLRIDGLAELDQSEVVDAAAFERDRALHAIGLDRHARRQSERRVAVGGHGGG